MIRVDSYGYHVHQGIPWLMQGRGGTNFIGLKQKCPFEVAATVCNHLIPAAAPIPDRVHWTYFQKIATDPLVQAMFPIPREPGDRCFFVEDPYDDLGLYLACLSRMSSPIRNVTKPSWMVKLNDIERNLTSSNIQPWVITQATTKQQELISALTKATDYLPRTVIVTGNADLVIRAPMKRIETSIRSFELADMMTLPLEALGAVVLRRFGRKEELLGDIETRDVRRERLINERKTNP